MILNKYHKPFKDASNYVPNYILNLYLQMLIIFIIIKPVKGERREITEKVFPRETPFKV